METITRSGRAVQGFALGEVGRGGGGYHGGGYHGGRGGGRGLPGNWGWWGTPYIPDVEAQPDSTCASWGAPIVMPSGMDMAAKAALGASSFQPTVARGPDGVLYRFSVENSEIVVRPCAAQVSPSDAPVPQALFSGPPPVVGPYPGPGAWRTDRAYIRRYQTALTWLGFDTKGLDGVYTPRTAYAVKLFQVEAGISPVDGRCGPTTGAKIDATMVATGMLGESASTGLAGVDIRVSPVFASLMTGAAAGLLAHVLHAPMWGAIVTGVGAALVTHVGIDKTA
jgi:hypothetical protein